MSFRDFLGKLKDLRVVSKPVSKHLEASAIINELNNEPVLFEKIKESSFRVAANVFPAKQSIADYLQCSVEELIPKIMRAIENPTKPEEITIAPCQEVEMNGVDLDLLPILFHTKMDGGNFISSGIAIATDSLHGQNVDFHRCMQIAKDKFCVRVVKSRHFDTFLERQIEMPVAICVGSSASVLLAAATSVEIGRNELEIANSLESLQVVKAKTFDAKIPADSEFVLEGTISLEERADEGPFVDLTETLDVVRREPVFTVKKITHRHGAIWQALLPGKDEHKILMGMPREPTIFKKVSGAGVKCLDVNVNPGGCNWLHARVKIDKVKEEDGKTAIKAAFEGHKSCKHIFVVDKDINIYDDKSVEWAMATRFQADKDLMIKKRERGSSLDPSAGAKNCFTSKCGFDFTKPTEKNAKNFERTEFPKADLKKFLE